MDVSISLQDLFRPASLVLLGLATILAVIVHRRYFSPLRDIPGPFLASFSRLWHLGQVLGGDQRTRLYELHKKHGPFVRIAHDEVSVSHPDAPKLLLLTPLEKGAFYKIGAAPDYRYQSTFSIRDPKRKIEHAKNFQPSYSLSNVLQNEAHIDATWSKFLNWMDTFARNEQPMELDHFFAYAAVDVQGELLFSKAFGFLDEGRDINDGIAGTKKANALGAVLAHFPWLHFALTNPFVTWLGILPYGMLFDRATAAVKERENNSDTRYDMLASWMRRHKEYPERLNLRQLYAQITLNVGAGSDGVAAALQSFVYHMIRHPGSWKRAQDEVKEAMKEGKCQDRVISYADAQQLPYVQACMKEALRVFGPTGMGLPRVAGKSGVTIGTRSFPEGTVLSTHTITLGLDEQLWGPDAQEFNPDRWFAADIAAKEKYWLVFGLGYASCPGVHLGKLQLAKMSATLVRNYNIRQVHPEKPWKFEAYFATVPYDWPVYVEKSPISLG